jgi:hypothetical protein
MHMYNYEDLSIVTCYTLYKHVFVHHPLLIQGSVDVKFDGCTLKGIFIAMMSIFPYLVHFR